MNTYIVHIYRREKDNRYLSGIAERIHDGAKQGFKTVEQLWTFLSTEATPLNARPAKTNSGDST